MLLATLLGLVEDKAPGWLETTFPDLLTLPWQTLEPWFEVVGGGGEESHDGTTRETPLTTPSSPPAEMVLTKLPPEGLPLDLTPWPLSSWTLMLPTLEWWLVLDPLLKPLGFLC